MLTTEQLNRAGWISAFLAVTLIPLSLDGESVDEACKRLDIPTEIIGPNGQRIETLIICRCQY
jgi:hypothetical protein